MDTRKFNSKRLKQSAADEFYGLCLGVLADGFINQAEVGFLTEWLISRIHHIDDPLIKQVYIQLEYIQRQGLNEKSESALLRLLLDFTGVSSPEPETTVPSSIPLCDPIPTLVFPGSTFCFTGKFDFGTRSECQKAVAILGSSFINDVTRNVDILVIGSQVNSDWLRESYGRKILKAMEYKQKFGHIAIISESHWLDSMNFS
ncbi:BRCT domain-containing protein [Oceanobacter antarcticus]|uniref:BRCT domain-containing protein n=1 Tax=Oceanobacter antarcticus TaxID=3133425 RepID=A0ABW8NDC9_9GAMM|tara:strand:+ start:1720 stop:2325 length:606 start_codon:yes stop_codon:yes gene_type:complete